MTIKKTKSLGVPVIKEWHFDIPFYKDSRIIQHAETKRQEVLTLKKKMGWGDAVSLTHDFVGKEALQKIKDGRHRIMVTLKWNAEDIIDIYRSEFEKGEPYAIMDGPEDYLETG